MYAIVDIAGQQFKVEKGADIHAPKLNGEVGDKVEFDRVLLIAKKDNVAVGTPVVEGAKVHAKILEHGKDKKVIVFKKKRRKGYKVKKGHRQQFTKLKIEKIVAAKPAA